MGRIVKWKTSESADALDIFIEKIKGENGSLISYHSIVSFKYFGAFTLVDMFEWCSYFFGGKICKNKILICFISLQMTAWFHNFYLLCKIVIKARLEAKITKLEDQYAHFEALIKIKNQQHVSIHVFQWISSGMWSNSLLVNISYSKCLQNSKDILAKEVSQLKLALHLERETSSKFVTSLDINDENNFPAVKSIMPRTCQEAKFADPLLKSGMLWIDPDGQGIGDDPIYVYCDMTSGKKS